MSLFGAFKYDSREEFTFKDGGKIYIDIKGDFSLSENKPLIFVHPGLTSHSQSCIIRSIVTLAHKEGFIVVVINYRGLAGMKL
jgi:predicted alpha/beta-fold hydrolase